MSKKKCVKIGVTLLGIAFLVNASGSLFGDPMDGVFPEIKKLAGYDKQDLVYLSGGYSNGLLGRSAKAEFQIKGGDKRETIRIAVRKPLHLIPWQVQKFEDNS